MRISVNVIPAFRTARRIASIGASLVKSFVKIKFQKKPLHKVVLQTKKKSQTKYKKRLKSVIFRVACIRKIRVPFRLHIKFAVNLDADKTDASNADKNLPQSK
ncbi:MAG: hypothetical protein ACOYBS_03305 [Flavobacterium sp.]